MKKIKILVMVIVFTIICVFCSGCEQSITKKYGGSMTVNLPVNTKLEGITWKDNSLWYLTRPMREDEEAEVHTFQESSEFGILEGTVTVKETKKELENE